MDGDPLGPQQPVCIFCWPHRDDNGALLRNPDGSLIRDCSMCVGLDGDRWCQHDCYWLIEGNP